MMGTTMLPSRFYKALGFILSSWAVDAGEEEEEWKGDFKEVERERGGEKSVRQIPTGGG